jgi:hypothetical protein
MALDFRELDKVLIELQDKNHMNEVQRLMSHELQQELLQDQHLN